MRASTGRQRAVAKALTALLPLAPYADTEAIRTGADARHLRSLPPSVAVWLATVAHVRHAHTDYEACWRKATTGRRRASSWSTRSTAR